MPVPTTHLVLLFLTVSALTVTPGAGQGRGNNNLKEACRVTRYQSLCMRSLASYSHPAGRSPQLWARAGVSVTLAEAERVQNYVAGMNSSGLGMSAQARMAMSDCTECLGDVVDELHGALGELRRLERSTFEYQMNNVETWVSSALTDQNTCLDGLGELKAAQLGDTKSKVLNTTYLTSNALALINKLASSGGSE